MNNLRSSIPDFKAPNKSGGLDSLCPTPSFNLTPTNERFVAMRNQKQLELGLATANRCPRVAQRERRLNRANWWFDQMRQVVDRAFEWEPAPRPRSEQILLNERAD